MGEHVMIACVSLAGDLRAGELAGAWLASYDPDGNDGHGDAAWSHDPADAMVLTEAEAAELYRAVPATRPLREDGQPNRPLTRFTVMFVPVPDPGQPPPRRFAPRPHLAEPVSLADGLRDMGLM